MTSKILIDQWWSTIALLYLILWFLITDIVENNENEGIILVNYNDVGHDCFLTGTYQNTCSLLSNNHFTVKNNFFISN
jgi:hypothetical protein